MTAPILALVTVALVMAWSPPAPRRLPPSHGTTSATARGRDLFTRARRTVDRAFPGARRRRRDLQLPDALDRLASSLRAGRAVGPAIVTLAPELDDPLRAELAAVAQAIERGTPVARALGRWTDEEGASADVELVAAALTIGAGAGGEVARAIDGVAATLRERHRARAELHALATQARSSAAVLAVAPIAFAALVATVEASAVAFLLTTPVGLACLVLGLALDAVGIAWMARITRSAG